MIKENLRSNMRLLLFFTGCYAMAGCGGGSSSPVPNPDNPVTQSDGMPTSSQNPTGSGNNPGDSGSSTEIELRAGRKIATPSAPTFWDLVRTGESGALLVWGQSESAEARSTQQLFSVWKPAATEWPTESRSVGIYKNIGRGTDFEDFLTSIPTGGAELSLGNPDSREPYSYFKFNQPSNWSEEQTWSEAVAQAGWQFNQLGDAYSSVRKTVTIDFVITAPTSDQRGRGYLRPGGAMDPVNIAGSDLSAIVVADREKSFFGPIVSMLDDTGRVHLVSIETVVQDNTGDNSNVIPTVAFGRVRYWTSDTGSRAWSESVIIAETPVEPGPTLALLPTIETDWSPSGQMIIAWKDSRSTAREKGCVDDQDSYSALRFDGSQWSSVDIPFLNCNRDQIVTLRSLSIDDNGAITAIVSDRFNSQFAAAGVNSSGSVSEITDVPSLEDTLRSNPNCDGRSVKMTDEAFTELHSGLMAYTAVVYCQDEEAGVVPNVYALALSTWDADAFAWTTPSAFEFGDNIQFDQIGVSDYDVLTRYKIAQTTDDADIEAVVLLSIIEGIPGLQRTITDEFWAGSLTP